MFTSPSAASNQISKSHIQHCYRTPTTTSCSLLFPNSNGSHLSSYTNLPSPTCCYVLYSTQASTFWDVMVISYPNKPIWKTHNPVIMISYVPRLGRSSAMLTCSPAIRPFPTCSFSYPCGSPPSWLPSPLLLSPFLQLLLPYSPKPLVPPFPSNAQSQAVTFTDQLEWWEGSHEITWISEWYFLRGNPS